MIPVLEAVPNLSFGEDPRLLDDAVALVHRAGAEVVDQSSDPDHNRSVLTIMGHPQSVEVAVVGLAAWARDHIDLRTHRGVHPRVGALDVLPLIPLAGLEMDDVRRLARRIGVRIVEEVGVPVWFYAEASDPPGRSLAALRWGGFEALVSGCPPGREPDLVPSGWASSTLHPTAGGICVGARPVLLAWNVDVEGVPASHLREEAQRLRASSGGPAGLRVLVLDLPKQARVQVSMNLEGAESQDPFAVFLEVERCVRSLGGQVVRTEIIGMSPDALSKSAAASRLSLAPGDAIRPLSEALRTHLEGRVHRAVEDLRSAVRGCNDPIPPSLQLALERFEAEFMLGGGGGSSSLRPVPPFESCHDRSADASDCHRTGPR